LYQVIEDFDFSHPRVLSPSLDLLASTIPVYIKLNYLKISPIREKMKIIKGELNIAIF